MLGSICEFRLYDTICFLLDVSSLFQHVDLGTTSVRAGLIYIRVWVGGYHVIVFGFFLVLSFFALTRSQSFI